MHELNREQQQALQCGLDHICLVTAGPGSGKTRFLVERIARIARASPSEGRLILCFAFTNEAANEIQGRVNDCLLKTQMVTISTIHRFCTSVLRTFTRLQRPGSQSLRVMKDSDHFCTFLVENVPFKLLKAAWKDLCQHDCPDPADDLSDTTPSSESSGGDDLPSLSTSDDSEADRASKSLIRMFRGLQNGSIDMQSISGLESLMQAFAVYDSAMESANIIDIRCIVGKFVRDFDMLAPLFGDIHYLLVDEFQDLDEQQLELVKLLINHGLILTAVGDFNQSIYSWRARTLRPYSPDQQPAIKARKRDPVNILHSNPKSYDSLISHMGSKPHAEFSFILNHRNDYEIGRASNLLVGKPVVPSADDIPTALGFARVVVCRSPDDEYAKIIQLLKCMHLSNTLKDCAILVRYNTDKEKLGSLLKQSGIPTIEKRRSFMSRISSINNSNSSKSFKTILCLIRAIAVPNDPVAFITGMKLACLTSHNKDIELELIQTVMTVTEFVNCHEWWDRAEMYDPLAEETRSEFSPETLQVQHNTRTLNGIRVKSLITQYTSNIRKCMNCGTLQSLVAEIKSVFKIRTTRDIGLLEDLVKGRDVPIKESMKFLREPDQWGTNSTSERTNAVYVSTIHSAKGREWSTVLIPFVNEGTIPSMVGEIGEERRVFYVGMTRAKHNLILTCHQAGRTIPSRFISDCQIRPCERFDDILSRFG